VPADSESMETSRRGFLGAAATAGAAALGGCTDVVGPCGVSLGGMPEDATVAVEPLDSAPADGHRIAFADLTDPERALLAEAIDDGPVRLCPTDDSGRADALSRLSDRLQSESYLDREGKLYGLWVRVQDVILAGTADTP